MLAADEKNSVAAWHPALCVQEMTTVRAGSDSLAPSLGSTVMRPNTSASRPSPS
jgi:hypothetical protein